MISLKYWSILLRDRAELGKKVTLGEPLTTSTPEFNMFYNELAIGDNTVLIDLGKTKITFLNHSVIDFISTRDERFSNQMYHSLKNLISKSTQISTVGEKNRSHFFSAAAFEDSAAQKVERLIVEMLIN